MLSNTVPKNRNARRIYSKQSKTRPSIAIIRRPKPDQTLKEKKRKKKKKKKKGKKGKTRDSLEANEK
jgi:hypothetical protein